jgi:hypothetical protein
MRVVVKKEAKEHGPYASPDSPLNNDRRFENDASHWMDMQAEFQLSVYWRHCKAR